jgi:hypothetical protein
MARETKGDQPIKDDETLLLNSELQYNVLQPPFRDSALHLSRVPCLNRVTVFFTTASERSMWFYTRLLGQVGTEVLQSLH